MWLKLLRCLMTLLWLAAPLPAMSQDPGCTSLGADALRYVRHPTPVLEAGEEDWHAGGVLHVAVCQVGDVFHMYYTGLAKTGYAYRCIGYASSVDGIRWQRRAAPVLSRGAADEFDDVHVHMPSVVYDAAAKKFRMWYAGYQNNRGNTIGYAESTDGIRWQKRGQVLGFGSPQTFDSGSLREPSVFYDARTRLYKMWYNGTMPNQHYGPTGYAISEDGIHWGRVTVINGDQERFIGIHVVKHQGCWHGWYGTGPEIGYARSKDGLRWDWPEAEIVLQRGETFDSRYAQAPVVIIDEAAGKVRLWYNGASGAEETLAVGYAEASLK